MWKLERWTKLPPDEVWLARLERDDPLPDADRAAIRALDLERVEIERGSYLRQTGVAQAHVYLVTSGWAIRETHQPDGRRQIAQVITVGDYVGLIALRIRRSDWSAVAVTDMTAVAAPATEIEALRENAPKAYDRLVWQNMQMALGFAEQIVRLGVQSATERLGHFILELRHRLGLVGLGNSDKLQIPLTQEVLADILGMTVVHLNRTLRKLDDAGLIDHRKGEITVLNLDGLTKLAQFDDDYMDEPELPDEDDATGTSWRHSASGDGR